MNLRHLHGTFILVYFGHFMTVTILLFRIW